MEEIGIGTGITVQVLRPYFFGLFYLPPSPLYDFIFSTFFFILIIFILSLTYLIIRRTDMKLKKIAKALAIGFGFGIIGEILTAHPLSWLLALVIIYAELRMREE